VAEGGGGAERGGAGRGGAERGGAGRSKASEDGRARPMNGSERVERMLHCEDEKRGWGDEG
jgi:hypothetical protein